MAHRLSRAALAHYIADHAGTADQKKAFQMVAGYLLDTRRTKELELIIKDVERIMAERGMVQATVTSAQPLTARLEKAMQAYVKKETGAASVSLDSIIDESVIGGFKLSLPDTQLDRTIRHQLTTLTRYKKA